MVVTVEDAKQWMRVFHSADDDLIRRILEGAEQEALDIMDRPDFSEWLEPSSESEPESEPSVPAAVNTAIMLLAQASYEATPSDMEKLRLVAKFKLDPYRKNLGA